MIPLVFQYGCPDNCPELLWKRSLTSGRSFRIGPFRLNSIPVLRGTTIVVVARLCYLMLGNPV